MDLILTLRPFPRHIHTLSLLCFALLSLISSVKPIDSDYNALVYRNCANQTFTPPTESPQTQQTLSSLFQQLIAHSSQSKFFRHTAGNDETTGISGLFQCREDISNEDCHSCVTTLPNLSNTLCKDSVSARVQLHGCYMHYELDGVNSEPSTKNLMHKTCGELPDAAAAVAGGFEEMRAAAFAALENGVLDGGGFCKTAYEAVQVTAQCLGGLGGCECGECVSKAAQIAEEECGGAVSAQIYLEQCFLSYIYHPDQTPDHPHPDEKRDKKGSVGKSAAIVVGGAAALGFGFIFLLFVKSWSKKEDD